MKITRIIAFAAGKGGVGKSTITANLAVAAAQLGEEVVLVDADIPMADLALSLGMDVEGPTLHEVLSGEVDFEDAVYSGPEGVKIVPAGISLNGVRKAKPRRLEDVLEGLSDKFGTILIDSPPGLGTGALTILRLSDEVVLVTIPVVNSLTDALRTKEVTERFGSDPIGVIVSRTFDADSDVPRKEVSMMLDLPILGVVPEDPEVRKSTSLGKPLMARGLDSPSSKVFRELAEEIVIKRGEINYEELAQESISDIKELAKEKTLNYKRMLKVERENKDRKTLKDWLKTKVKD